MNPHKEFALGLLASGVTVFLAWISVATAVVGLMTGLTALAVYLLKLRKELRHKDD